MWNVCDPLLMMSAWHLAVNTYVSMLKLQFKDNLVKRKCQFFAIVTRNHCMQVCNLSQQNLRVNCLLNVLERILSQLDTVSDSFVIFEWVLVLFVRSRPPQITDVLFSACQCFTQCSQTSKPLKETIRRLNGVKIACKNVVFNLD